MPEGQRAMAALFERSWLPVQRLIRRTLAQGGAEADVEDATQNVMLSLLGVDRPVNDPERYIRRSARFRAIDAWRAESRGIDCTPASDSAESWYDAHGASPEASVAQRERCQAVERALDGLDTEVRDLVLGVYVEEAPMRIVAQRVGVPVRTAWRRVSRALDQLRHELAPALH